MKNDFVWALVIFMFCVVGIYYGIKNGGLSSPINKIVSPSITQNNSAGENSTSATKTYSVSMNVYGEGSSDYNNEYVEIYASGSNSAPINITGWTLVSERTGNKAVIPKGVTLYSQTGSNVPQDVYLKPGERAIISSSNSPIGVSTKLNICSGYLTQERYFAQSIPRSCPIPNEESVPITNLDDRAECYDYIESLPKCRVQNDNSFPKPDDSDVLPSACVTFIKNNLNYGTCVAQNLNNKKFDSGEWRIFLGAYKALWRNDKDNIKLIDRSGNVVDSVEY